MASATLLSLKAGILNLNGTTVTADKRKGLLTLSRAEDILFRLTWKERSASAPEIDLLLVPGDATWKRVTKCTTGRVYLLEFVGSNQRFFFWMQEPSEDKDAEYETKINGFINPGGSNATPVSTPSQPSASASSTSAEQSRPAQTPQQPPPQASAPAPVPAPETQPATTPAPQPSQSSQPSSAQPSGGLLLDHLQSILSNMGVPPASDEPETDLNQVINTDVLVNLLRNNPSSLKELLPHLPEDRRYETAEDVRSILRSPQFRQAVHGFAQALQTDQLATLLLHLNLDPSVISGSTSGVEAFLKAIQNRYGAKQ